MLLPRIFNNGFGLVSVIGVNLVPNPAHKMIARMKFEVELCFVESKFAESAVDSMSVAESAVDSVSVAESGVDSVKVVELFAKSNFAESAVDSMSVVESFAESNFAESASFFRESNSFVDSNSAESGVDSAESTLFPPPHFKI